MDTRKHHYGLYVWKLDPLDSNKNVKMLQNNNFSPERLFFSRQMCDITRERGGGWQSVLKCEMGEGGGIPQKGVISHLNTP